MLADEKLFQFKRETLVTIYVINSNRPAQCEHTLITVNLWIAIRRIIQQASADFATLDS